MLKAGFIGFGRMGITHFSILNTNPLVKPVGICDKSQMTMNVLGKYMDDIHMYSDYRKLIETDKPDFVVISTPTDSHAEVINYALDHNIHVFTEKPLSLSTKEGKDILLRTKNKRLVNQVGYVNRFNEVFEEVKKIIGAGLIGEIKNFKSEMYGATVLKDSKGNWRGKRQSGGGCMYEFASHCIDLVVYLFGKPDRVSGSVMQKIFSSNVEDLVTSNLFYSGDYGGTIMVNWSDASYRKPTNIITILGTKGKIIADKHAYKIFCERARG